jgi:hypothetical protein
MMEFPDSRKRGPTAPQGKQESNILQMSLYKAN